MREERVKLRALGPGQEAIQERGGVRRWELGPAPRVSTGGMLHILLIAWFFTFEPWIREGHAVLDRRYMKVSRGIREAGN